jgi:hypothetical protein
VHKKPRRVRNNTQNNQRVPITLVETPEPVRPALQVVRARQAAKRRGLTFRWQMDPVERRLVQVWEPRD